MACSRRFLGPNGEDKMSKTEGDWGGAIQGERRAHELTSGKLSLLGEFAQF